MQDRIKRAFQLLLMQWSSYYGEGHFIIGGDEHILKKGELIIMPAKCAACCQCRQKFKMMLIMLKA